MVWHGKKGLHRFAVTVGLNGGMSKGINISLVIESNFSFIFDFEFMVWRGKKGLHRFALRQGRNRRPKWRHV